MTGPRRLLVLVAMVCLLSAAARSRAEESKAPGLAREALAECESGRRATDRADRQAHFERGQALAQQAIGADETNAQSHFALFCNMGELMRIDGESVSSVFALHRLMGELDRAIALDPEYYDALAAKGTLLVRLPRLLGGDPDKGEQLLRHVIQSDPNAFASRLTLARACDARGDREEAIGFATRALQIAREQGRADKIAQARAALDELRAGR